MNNFYNVIMDAADLIERHPRKFDFDVSEMPKGLHCNSPGCALGWIGYLAGVEKFLDIQHVAKAMGADEMSFYGRMDELDPAGGDWYDDAAACAHTLRLYAEKYYGHERQVAELKASLQIPEPEVA